MITAAYGRIKGIGVPVVGSVRRGDEGALGADVKVIGEVRRRAGRDGELKFTAAR